MNVDTIVSLNKNARGLAVIIYNEYEGDNSLPGVGEDARAMEKAFKFLRFAIIALKDGTEKQIRDIIGDVVNYKSYPENYNCFAIVFSGHGGSGKTIFSHDLKRVNFDEAIIQPLRTMPNHQSLEAKLVFIDACRGSKSKGDQVEKFEISVLPNLFVAYSTMEEYVAFMMPDHKKGSVWMQILAKELMENKTSSIGDLVAGVNKKLQLDSGKQHPQIFNQSVMIKLYQSG